MQAAVLVMLCLVKIPAVVTIAVWWWISAN